jgi:fructosamine-3-kinase
MTARESSVREALARELGGDVGELQWSRVGGGSINSAARVLAAGRSYFVKWNDRALPRHFEAEAMGLRALGASGAVIVPRPIAWSDAGRGESYLLLEDLGSGAPRADFERRFGAELARLHAQTEAHGFGFAMDGYCGATPQPNRWSSSWIEFYAEQRLGHMLRLCAARGFAASVALERLIADLAKWLEEPPASSLLHGDLWIGNLHVTASGEPALLDPAAYYGHREAELGMMQLFGGFAPEVWRSYEAAAPLSPGWRERLPLYELYHVLNHYVLFGGGYGAQAGKIVRRFVG